MAPEESQRFEAEYQHGSTAPQTEREPRKKKSGVQKEQTDRNRSALMSSKEKVFILLLMVIIGVSGAATIFFHAWASQIKYTVDENNQKVEKLSNEIDNLEVELNSFSDLAEIEEKAATEYNMVYPDHTKYIEVEPMKDSNAVNKYISSLTASQRGLAAGNHVSATAAARHLLSRA